MKSTFQTLHLVGLGCPKNRVDAEIMWAQAVQLGLQPVDNPAEADVIVVNTCAFLRSAVEESLQTILRLSAYKKTGCCRRLVVAGCLTGRFGRSLTEELPEVDLFVGPGEVGRIADWLRKEDVPRFQARAGHSFLLNARTSRANSLSLGAAYLKIAEGCSRKCSFCVIPSIRGPLHSRPLPDILREGENLVRGGVQEIILIAQDLNAYGSDLPDRPGLADLVEALAGIERLRWLRLMYLYPVNFPKRLLRLMADHPNVLPYLDVPLQHVDPGILKNMRRGGNLSTHAQQVRRLRGEIPGVVLRSAFITGFPGESPAAFRRLVDFVEEIRFERLGVFCFSPEEGSPAAALPDKVPGKVAKARRGELLVRQRRIALEYHQSLVGQELEVLLEETAGPGRFVGRAWNQAPEVDGLTRVRVPAALKAAKPFRAGQIVRVRIHTAGPYDLGGVVVSGIE